MKRNFVGIGANHDENRAHDMYRPWMIHNEYTQSLLTVMIRYDNMNDNYHWSNRYDNT